MVDVEPERLKTHGWRALADRNDRRGNPVRSWN